MFSLDEIFQLLKQAKGKIIIKKKNKNQLILFVNNQDLILEIDANRITIKGNKNSSNPIFETAENAEKIKEILKKFLKDCEIIIEIQ